MEQKQVGEGLFPALGNKSGKKLQPIVWIYDLHKAEYLKK